ncbi:potassium channel family protein [Desulfosudis oleivorans]|uniref:TrkA-N domain protein n=1 Tax=Desulfosudis oleivorans (strain DSM 6200 / JCM 39069 / Hxd3) TaxID=96561 RepID=A8ZSQ8_DESOH|nr:NAD-binding protein [Desulfosudis oleivorans]ABW65971.1 TrkA-N domain protein [Desulfosudis oleivorans Hxd3]
MKTMATQLSLLLQADRRRGNIRLLVKFCLMLACFFVLYSVLFHVLMVYEGRSYSWITGFYWTLTTMSTLGFGDITFTSDIGKVFSVVVLLSGIIFLLVMLPFTFIQFFYAPWLEEQNKARTPRAVAEALSGHVIFTHYDDITIHLIRKLEQHHIRYVLLVADLQAALNLHDQGYHVVVGDLDDPDTYPRLNVDRAALVVVLNDDVVSTNIIYTIREISPDVITVTNADREESLDILKLAGSTHVLQMTRMLGQALARRVYGVSMTANVIGRFDELLIAEASAMRTWLQGKTLAESRLRQVAGVTVVGIWEQGRFIMPGPHSRIGESTVLVLAGTEEQLNLFDRSIAGKMADSHQKGPVLVIGGGRVGTAVADTLKGREVEFRVVEKRSDIASRHAHYIEGSAAEREVLDRAGLQETPAVIITTHDDNLNIYLTIYIRRLRPDVQIISRSSLDRNITTLHRAGANLVLSYSSLLNSTILNLLQPQKMLMLSEGLNMFRAALNEKMVSQALADLSIREQTGCSVMAVKRAGELIVNPDPAIVLEAGDELLLIGLTEAEKTFMERYPPDKK